MTENSWKHEPEHKMPILNSAEYNNVQILKQLNMSKKNKKK